jgi:hypothetical protein
MTDKSRDYIVQARVRVHDPDALIEHAKRRYIAGHCGDEEGAPASVEAALVTAIITDQDDTAPLDFGCEFMNYEAGEW